MEGGVNPSDPAYMRISNPGQSMNHEDSLALLESMKHVEQNLLHDDDVLRDLSNVLMNMPPNTSDAFLLSSFGNELLVFRERMIDKINALRIGLETLQRDIHEPKHLTLIQSMLRLVLNDARVPPQPIHGRVLCVDLSPEHFAPDMVDAQAPGRQMLRLWRDCMRSKRGHVFEALQHFINNALLSETSKVLFRQEMMAIANKVTMYSQTELLHSLYAITDRNITEWRQIEIDVLKAASAALALAAYILGEHKILVLSQFHSIIQHRHIECLKHSQKKIEIHESIDSRPDSQKAQDNSDGKGKE